MVQNAIVKKHSVHSICVVCAYCEKDHHLYKCKKFLSLNVNDRWKWVKEEKLCFRCILANHRRDTCRAKSCNVSGCTKPHNRLLHALPQPSAEPDSPQPSEDPPTTAATVAQLFSCDMPVKHTYLKVVPVSVCGPKGSIDTYALLDEGSTVSLLDQDVALRIGTQGPTTAMEINTLKGRYTDTSSSSVNIQVRGQYSKKAHNLTNVRTMRSLKLMTQTISRAEIEHLSHLKGLLDRVSYVDAEPKLLIGQDNWHLIVTKRIRRGKKNQPVASYTGLGWVLHGFAATTHNLSEPSAYAVYKATSRSNDELQEEMRKHFALEAIGITPKAKLSSHDERALQILKKETKNIGDRYEVPLLWAEEDTEITRPHDWRWLSTRDNVADDVSRGVASLTNEHRWFTGPDFLDRKSVV